MVIELIVNPLPKPRMTQRDRWSKRPCVLRYWEYADKLREEASFFKYSPEDELSVHFYIPMPKSWSKKKKKTYNNQPHQQKPDLDNLIKAFQDILCKEDQFIHTYKDCKKIWSYTGAILVGD